MSSPAADKKLTIERKGRIREVVFGVQDGLISTVGFLAGLRGVTTDNRLLLFAGLVQMLAGAMSMAAGAYLSSKAEVEIYQREIDEEQRRFEQEPYLAREELLQAMVDEGVSRDQAYRIVKLLQGHEHSMLKTFQEKVLGLASINPSTPIASALVIGVWFMLGSAVPLAPYFMLSGDAALATAVLLSTAALFGIGCAKAILVQKSLWRSGLEFLLIAAGAAGLGYLFGLALPDTGGVGAEPPI